ncbi:MAG: dimethyl sulfoxide reductase anchor subunit family protein, partial [Alphaproteobacteria bacterium]
REGLFALVTFVPAGLFGIGWVIIGQTNGAWAWFGGIAAVLSVLTVYATGMIYASLKPIPNWCNRWVAPIYFAFSLATGATWLYALLRLFGLNPYPLAIFGAVFGAVAWAAKVGYWRFIDRPHSTSTTGTATGLGGGSDQKPVRLLDAPHLEENYLQREMGYQIARKHTEKLRRIALIVGIAALFLMLVAGASSGLVGTLAALLAVLLTALAVLIERWLFFAEAKHAVTLYYGNQSI